MLNKKKKQKILLTIAFVVLAWVIALNFISPREIINLIGIKNSYLVVFVLAVVGGLSTITGTSLFIILFTFSQGGANPWLLGIIGGIGIFISDSIFFFLAYEGVQVIGDGTSKLRKKIINWIEDKPKWLVGIFVYLYVGFTPLPNDLLMIALNIGDVRYRNILLPVLLGSITIATLASHISILF